MTCSEVDFLMATANILFFVVEKVVPRGSEVCCDIAGVLPKVMWKYFSLTRTQTFMRIIYQHLEVQRKRINVFNLNI